MSLQLDQFTVLTGENNTGKSTILDALQLTLGRYSTAGRIKFERYDHHIAKSAEHAVDGDIIEIVLYFVEHKENEWADNITREFANVIQIDNANKKSVIFRVRSRYDANTNESVPEWDFLDSDLIEISGNMAKYRKALQESAPIFALKSTRNTKHEFSATSSFWGPFVRSMSTDPNVRQALENEMVELNQKIIDAHNPFTVIKEHLGNIAKLVPLTDSDTVSIESLTDNVLDILSKTRVSLTSSTGAKIPVGRHGEGTQSLAIICLFGAFLQSNLQSHDSKAYPILTLEEPEAHLHPSAASSVTTLLQNPNGQSIIATHSGDLISNTPVSSLRRLSRKDGEIIVSQVDTNAFNAQDEFKIDHHIRTTRGNLLFARCWLLVEGKVDRMVFEQCAAICGIDLISKGVYCIEYSHIGKPQILIKFAKQLGIEWFVVADGDDAGNGYIKSAKKELQGKDTDHILQLDDVLEVLLCLEGYGHHYENLSKAKHINDTVVKDAAYWKDIVKDLDKHDKTSVAVSVMDEMLERGRGGIPDKIHRIIAKSIHLAGKGQ